MEQKLVSLFADFGLLVVVANVLLDQTGFPVPAMPTLILAGAIAATNMWATIGLFVGGVGACLIANSGWFLAGRWYGSRVMKLLCRISISPDSCVSETQLRFERWGASALIVAKFVPGLTIVAPPLAGATAMNWLRFLLYSAVGSIAWVGAGLGIGIALRSQIDRLLPRLQQVGSAALGVLVTGLLAYIAYKWYLRRQFYATLRMARIDVAELYQLIEAGASPLIVDVRSATAHSVDPRAIPGALRIPVANIKEHLAQLPRERDIVLYCTCPNEASAAQVAKLLLEQGFRRVRPLHGGLDAWIAAGYRAEIDATSSSIRLLSQSN
jgi:membrane protein DedA with SNARE-associated domain/rhodanese-related sulfurtransferase